eukprot:6953998-Alexandrium_andersonii.AAC.1
MRASLVGSEMCIRDRSHRARRARQQTPAALRAALASGLGGGALLLGVRLLGVLEVLRMVGRALQQPQGD